MSLSILYVSRLLAKISTSLFAGGALYCSFVEHPGRMKCDLKTAATEYQSSMKRYAVVLSVLTLESFASTMIVNYLEPDTKWLASGLVAISILPYTLLTLTPVTLKLIDPKRDRESNETKELLVKWGHRHAIRSVLGFVAMVLLQI